MVCIIYRGKSAFHARRNKEKIPFAKLEPLSLGGRNTRTVTVLPAIFFTSRENTPRPRPQENKFMYSCEDTSQKVRICKMRDVSVIRVLRRRKKRLCYRKIIHLLTGLLEEDRLSAH